MDEGQELVRLGVTLLDLVRGGARTTTYKPATLHALIEVLASHSDRSGRAPDRVDLRELAERVLALYWPQVRGYDTLDRTGLILRQISDRNRGSVILRAVRTLYERTNAVGGRSPVAASSKLPEQYDRAVLEIHDNLRRYPLARLQRPAGYREGQDYPRPLYDDRGFGEKSRLTELVLHTGTGERLLALSGLLVPAVQAEWTQQVASLNQLPSEDLREHLFGQERQDLHAVREVLRDLQSGQCLYCRGGLVKSGQVDHVVPWSLHPQDAIENLVLAHDRCNASKSAYLLDMDPLSSWASRDLAELRAAAESVGWISRPDRVFSLARAAYTHSGSSLLWSAGGTRLPDDGDLEQKFVPMLQLPQVA